VASGRVPESGKTSFAAESSGIAWRGSRTTCQRRPVWSAVAGRRNCALGALYVADAPSVPLVAAVSARTSSPVLLKRRSTTCIGNAVGTDARISTFTAAASPASTMGMDPSAS
jgi:hypothetical protein